RGGARADRAAARAARPGAGGRDRGPAAGAVGRPATTRAGGGEPARQRQQVRPGGHRHPAPGASGRERRDRVLGRGPGPGAENRRRDGALPAVHPLGRRGPRGERSRTRAVHRPLDRRAPRRPGVPAPGADDRHARVGRAAGGCKAMKILLVDDDPDLLSVTTFALQQAGFLVVQAANGPQALAAFEAESPDLAVLDINMPGMDGFELARRLRARSAIPLLMLTVRHEEQDVVKALSRGADDYLAKPYSPKILVARVRALLRRAGIEEQGAVTSGPLTLRPEDLQLDGLPSGPVKLTRLEARLLQLLLANAGRTVPSERILAYVWGNRAGGNRQLLKQLVHRLRQKVETDPANPVLLKTVAGSGYVFEPDAASGSGRREGV